MTSTEVEPQDVEQQEFRIGFVAEIFGHQVVWVRWAETSKLFRYPDNRLIMPRRTRPKNAPIGFRLYSLDQIDAMAQSLLRQGRIDEQEYYRITYELAHPEIVLQRMDEKREARLAEKERERAEEKELTNEHTPWPTAQ